jgi:hypothetical protein
MDKVDAIEESHGLVNSSLQTLHASMDTLTAAITRLAQDVKAVKGSPNESSCGGSVGGGGGGGREGSEGGGGVDGKVCTGCGGCMTNPAEQTFMSKFNPSHSACDQQASLAPTETSSPFNKPNNPNRVDTCDKNGDDKIKSGQGRARSKSFSLVSQVRGNKLKK